VLNEKSRFWFGRFGRCSGRQRSLCFLSGRSLKTQTEGHRRLALVTGFGSAKQIGLTIPQSVLYRADKVIKESAGINRH
jgi:hypothetical protein